MPLGTYEKELWNSESDFSVVQIRIQVVSKLLLTLGCNSISSLWSDFRYPTGKAAFTSRCGHQKRGCRGVHLPHDQHRRENKSVVPTVERELYLVIKGQQVLDGICGQLEQIGYFVTTYQCSSPREKGHMRIKRTWPQQHYQQGQCFLGKGMWGGVNSKNPKAGNTAG